MKGGFVLVDFWGQIGYLYYSPGRAFLIPLLLRQGYAGQGYNTLMQAFINYLRDVRSEMTHVSWPSRAQAIGYTALVIAIVIVTALILGASDFIFTYGLEKIVTR